MNHRFAAAALEAAVPPLILSPFVLAELDYMVTRDLGASAQRVLQQDVADGAYTLAPFGPADVMTAIGILDRYADQAIGLTDASLVVLADRYGTVDILTFDRRHFGALRTRSGAFRLVADEAV